MGLEIGREMGRKARRMAGRQVRPCQVRPARRAGAASALASRLSIWRAHTLALRPALRDLGQTTIGARSKTAVRQWIAAYTLRGRI
jgi:hypothetical protein